MEKLFYFIFALVVGSLVGRFISYVVIFLPKILLSEDDEQEPRDILTQFVRKPHCWQCRKEVSWLKNLPIIGFIVQRGKCELCQKSIDRRVILLEVGMSLLFGFTLLAFPFTVSTLFVLIASSFLVAACVTDFDYQILPDQITLPLLWVGLIASLFPVFADTSQAILGAVMGYGFFWISNAIYRRYRGFEGMYPGDFKLNAAIGACVGVYRLIPVILFSLVLLIVVAILFYALRKKDEGTGFLYQEYPYGCFSTVVTIVVLYLLLSKYVDLDFFAHGV